MINKNKRIHLVNNAPNIYDRAKKSRDGVVTAVLSVASVEAFIHDLANWLNFIYEFERENSIKNKKVQDGYMVHVYAISELGCKLNPQEKKILTEIKELELKKESAKNKIDAIIKILQPSRSTEMKKSIEDFSFLISIRNDIVHPKGEKLVQELRNEKTRGNISGNSKNTRRLETERLIDKVTLDQSWLNSLDDDRFISWCLGTVSGLMESILEILPKTVLMERYSEQAKVGRYKS